ncbi:MAG: VWA domain-containing protein [Bacteroidetes bacterium]|nr:VWA domain-containing protein [Bacteroidota bacterium]
MRSLRELLQGRPFVVGTLFLLLGCIPDAQAQPNLNFKRITVNWPTIELYFVVGCNGQPAYNMAKQDFRIFENGVEVPDFTLWCPDPTVRCPISVSLVFDASGSMSGAGNAGAKAGGRAFVDKMDGQIDEAAIIWFTSVVNIQQHMTTIKPMLYASIDALPASGATAVWDGCYAGILELINNGVNQCRAVIVLTDGGDNSSTRTPSEIISLANKNNIKVFTIGLGSSVNATELEMIALLTGGKYYQTPNAGQLAAIFGDIYDLISTYSFAECVITYEADCADGGMRTVELQLNNFCGGTDVKTKTYRAPLDSTTFSPLRMKLRDVTVFGNQNALMPLDLVTPLNNEVLNPFSFTVLIDSSCMRNLSVTVPSGSLLEGVATDVMPVAGGLRVSTLSGKRITGSGILFALQFLGENPQDTTCCDIVIDTFSMDTGCRILEMEGGRLCIIPPIDAPLMSCAMETPAELTWDGAAQTFSPDPFSVTMRVTNSGPVDALNTRFRIRYDTAVVTRVSPQTDVLPGNPVDVAYGQESSATWQFSARKLLFNDRAVFSVDAMFDNHDTVTCTQSVPFSHNLECALNLPVITYDAANQQYTPSPFLVGATVQNTGGKPAENVGATISFAPSLSLAAGTSRIQPLTPSVISPGQTGSVMWRMQHPLVASPARVPVEVRIGTSDGDTVLCTGEVEIPAAKAAFTIRLSITGSLSMCTGDGVMLDAGPGYADYWWNTGDRTRRLTVRDAGSYFCIVTDNDGKQGVSDTVHVTVHPLPQPVIAAKGPMPFCEGDTLLLEATPGFVSYAWSNGGSGQYTAVNSAGEYWVTVTDSNGCRGMSDTITVVTWPAPVTPTIQRTGDVLLASMASAWQWYRNGQPLPGETNQFLALPDVGSYMVEVTDSNGCAAMSNPLDVTVLGTAELPSAVRSFELYPNPSNGRFTLSLSLERPSAVTVTLTDMLGRGIRSESFARSSEFHETLQLHDVTPGSYLLRVRLADGGVMTRVVVVE